VIVGVQNFGEVPPTSLISATLADWKRDLEDKSTMIPNNGLKILEERCGHECNPSCAAVKKTVRATSALYSQHACTAS
jgi:hypothetical protein